MIHAPQQRLAIASAFAAARLRLWNGHPGTKGDRFICHALFGPDTSNQQAVDVVMERLGGHYTLEDWISSKLGVPSDARTPQDVQGFRLRWLDSLIKEFSA